GLPVRRPHPARAAAAGRAGRQRVSRRSIAGAALAPSPGPAAVAARRNTEAMVHVTLGRRRSFGRRPAVGIAIVLVALALGMPGAARAAGPRLYAGAGRADITPLQTGYFL